MTCTRAAVRPSSWEAPAWDVPIGCNQWNSRGRVDILHIGLDYSAFSVILFPDLALFRKREASTKMLKISKINFLFEIRPCIGNRPGVDSKTCNANSLKQPKTNLGFRAGTFASLAGIVVHCGALADRATRVTT